MSPFWIDDMGRCFVRGRGRYWPWARVVMEDHLGRDLAPREVVHHVNGDRTDDRLENLVVVSPGEHMDAHRQELNDSIRAAIGNQVEVNCAACGRAFSRLRTRLAGAAAYCSHACAATGRRVTSCRHGHSRTPENTHTRKDGRTECLVCLRARSCRIRAATKEATSC